MLPQTLRELQEMTATVTHSDPDRTITRITNPTDRHPTGTVRAGYLGVDKSARP